MSHDFEAADSQSYDTIFQEFTNLNGTEGDSTNLPWLPNNPLEGYSYTRPQAQVSAETTETSQFSITQTQKQAPSILRPEVTNTTKRVIAKSGHAYGRGGKLACSPCRDAKRGWDVRIYSRHELIDRVFLKIQHILLTHPVRSVGNGARQMVVMGANCHLGREKHTQQSRQQTLLVVATLFNLTLDLTAWRRC